MEPNNKTQYKKLCGSDPLIPIFMQDWWLDAVCGNSGWDVSVIIENGQVRAAMPYPIKKKYGFTLMLNPPLTPHLGPWINYPDELSESKKIGYEHKIYKRLLEQIPHFDYFEMGFNPLVKNWQAFHWAGFNETTRYTYIIPPNQQNIDKKTRRLIRLASDHLTLAEDNNLRLFYDLQNDVFKRQGIDIPISYALVKKLYSILVKQKACKILIAKDKNENIHGAVFLVWDKQYMYLLMSGIANQSRHFNAKSLLVKESINLAHKANLTFNFEGSMIETVESYNRHFNPVQLPYFYLKKNTSTFIKWYRFFTGKK